MQRVSGIGGLQLHFEPVLGELLCAVVHLQGSISTALISERARVCCRCPQITVLVVDAAAITCLGETCGVGCKINLAEQSVDLFMLNKLNANAILFDCGRVRLPAPGLSLDVASPHFQPSYGCNAFVASRA